MVVVMASSLTVTNTLSSPKLKTIYKKLSIPIPTRLSSCLLFNPKTLSPLSLSLNLKHRTRHRTFAARADSQNGAEPPSHYDFDLFTIGAGSGGVRASRFAANFGASVAVCELPFSAISSETTGGVGGTCVLRGCVPKKLMVYASHYSHEFEESHGFGWKYDVEPKHDWSTLMANKNAELQRLTGIYKSVLKNAGVTLIEGRGKIVDPHTIDVDGKLYSARRILISVGGRPFIPEIPGSEYVIDSDAALDLPSKPEKIAIVGGGYIALEFAGIFNGLTSEVHVFIRQKKVLRGFDEEIRDFVAEQMSLRGIEFHTEESPQAIIKSSDGSLSLKTNKGTAEGFSHVMFATGRRPNTKNLGLETVGVKMTKNGAIEVDEYSRTSVPSIWAVGDVTDRVNLTPVALMEGGALAKTLFQNEPTKPDYRAIPSAVFSQPPIGQVGLTEEQAIQEYGDVDIFMANFRPLKATLSGLPDRVLMKLVVCAKTNKVLGLHMCGEDSPEIVQGFAVAVKAGNPPAMSPDSPSNNTSPHPAPAQQSTSYKPPPPRRGSSSSNSSSSVSVQSQPKSSKGLKTVIILVGAAVIAVVVLLLIILSVYCCKKGKHTLEAPSSIVVHPRDPSDPENMVKIAVANNTTGSLSTLTGTSSTSDTSSGTENSHVIESGNLVISVQVLRKVTEDFAPQNELGRGGFGTVYKGELEDGTKIAVKRMEGGVIGSKALDEFEAEIAVLSKVRHRHLVSLLGYSIEGNERILVYEYMPQGALSRHLFHWESLNLEPLSWTRRLSIALDVARGMEYLHNLARETFIHRDLKSSNILLGDDFRAKVSDFGLVKLAPDGEKSIATKLAGTFGYLAPEYAVMGKITTKADVFSFGVVLMELLTGLMALDESRSEESRYLAEWFWRIKSNKETLMAAIDTAIEVDEETFESISIIAELAGHCTAREPNHRPDMGHAVNVLSLLVEKWKPMTDESEYISGIDYSLPLPQMLKAWQETESKVSFTSIYSSKGSIPARPTGFADSFTSTDGR